MRSLSLLAAAMLAAPMVAQSTAVNAFHVYSNRTSFTSRGFLGGAAGETLQGYPADRYRGIGHKHGVPKKAAVYGFGGIVQDQNRTTAEKYRVIFRRADDTGKPDGTAGGVIARTGELTLPTAPGTGPIAWRLNINLGASGVSTPVKHTFFAGIQLSANARWTSDGQSSHASAYTTPTSTAGDPVRTGAPNHSWQVDAKGAVRNTNPRSWNYELHTRRGAFQIGVLQTATAPGRYGNCGNYPEANIHGLSFRLRDRASANGVAAVFASTSLIGGAPLPFDGHLYINPGTFVLVASGKLSATGELELKPAVFAPGKLKSLKGAGDLVFQGVILNVSKDKRFNIRMMNAQATNL